jgi:hypothetical protein
MMTTRCDDGSGGDGSAAGRIHLIYQMQVSIVNGVRMPQKSQLAPVVGL